MKSKLTWIVACALALGLIAAGCGDDDDGNDDSGATDTSASTETLTKAEFIEQGNEICRQGNAELQKAFQEQQGGDSGAELRALVEDTLIPSVQGQIDKIRALGPPDDQVTQVLDQAEGVLDELEADPAKLQGDPFGEVNKGLTEAGLTECAN
jgi:hypothetical protein